MIVLKLFKQGNNNNKMINNVNIIKISNIIQNNKMMTKVRVKQNKVYIKTVLV